MDSFILFADDLDRAYRRLTADLHAIGRADDGTPIFPNDDSVVKDLTRRAAARLGAAVAAAVKRAKRRHLFAGLVSARSNGLDVTPAVAQGTARRLLGRGLDTRETAALFAIRGRTAANKSSVTAHELEGPEAVLGVGIEPLLLELEHIKSLARDRWYHSSERAKVLADWSKQQRVKD